jgi:hypothetical protein
VFLVLSLAVTGCGRQHVTLQVRVLSSPNPTNYEFDAPIEKVRDAVKAAFGKWDDEEIRLRRSRTWQGNGDADDKRLLTILLQLPPGSLLWKGDGDALSKQLLTKPGNEYDAYFCGGDSPFGESAVYFNDGVALPYFADFHIHLRAINQRRTRVEITTYDSSVNTGVNAGWSPARGHVSLYVTVDPTTVEEYQILLMIGQQLGTMNMPVVVTPGPDSTVKQVTKSRGR